MHHTQLGTFLKIRLFNQNLTVAGLKRGHSASLIMAPFLIESINRACPRRVAITRLTWKFSVWMLVLKWRMRAVLKKHPDFTHSHILGKEIIPHYRSHIRPLCLNSRNRYFRVSQWDSNPANTINRNVLYVSVLVLSVSKQVSLAVPWVL